MSAAPRAPRHLRIGVYIDFVYNRDRSDGGLSADQAVVRYLTELAPRIDELVLFGRLDEDGPPAPYAIPEEGVRFVALPHYRSLADMRGLLGSVRLSCRRFADAVGSLDAVWLFGPHPLSLLFARIAKRRGVPVVLGVRQDFPRYIAARSSPLNRLWAVPLAWGHEAAYRNLARRTPTVVVGADLAGKYKAAGRGHVRAIGVSLVTSEDIVTGAEAHGRDWDGPELRVISVGRLDPEKNPLLLAEIISQLHARDPRWRLDVVGDGPLTEALSERAQRNGLEGVLRLHGHVQNGPALTALYRDAHALLHVSRTEGLPQVIFEAAAAGLPIVATDVGGVRVALGDGDAGLLVPPDDAGAAVDALERLRTEPENRAALIDGALAVARAGTIERSHDEVLDLVSSHTVVATSAAAVVA